jgi:hypothetical protein
MLGNSRLRHIKHLCSLSVIHKIAKRQKSFNPIINHITPL